MIVEKLKLAYQKSIKYKSYLASRVAVVNYVRSHDEQCIIREQENKLCSEKEARYFFNKYYRNKLTIPFIDYCIGTICTLRCKHCTQWNPYLRTKQWFDAKSVIHDMEHLLQYVDYIHGMSLIGGEPFAYKELSTVLQYCIQNSKIGFLVLTTNGTIFPADDVLRLLKNRKVRVVISNYGGIVKNRENFKSLIHYLRINGCNYQVYHNQHFLDLGSPKALEKKSEMELADTFWNCWIRNCSTIVEGKFYRCARAYAGIDIGLFEEEDISGDWFDIRKIKSKKEMEKKLKNFYGMGYMKTCAACNEEANRKQYKAGIQI